MYVPAAKRRRYLRRIFVSRSADRCDTCYLLATYLSRAGRLRNRRPTRPDRREGNGSRWARPDNEPTVIHFAPGLDHALLVDLRIGQVAVKVVGGPCFYKPLNRGSDYNEPASEPRIPRPTPTHCIPC